MRKHCMRILSVALAVILFMSSGNISAFASVVSENHVSQTQTEEVAATEAQPTKGNVAVSNNELEVVGTNSFGRMFAESLEETVCEQKDNQGYNVFSIEMTGIEAYVELEAVEDCILLVAIYDEAGEQLIASGSLDIVAGDEAAITEIDIAEAEMPQYFYLRGYLIEKDTYRPLCTAYESPNYTQEMQEFFAKTTDDFDEDRVLNLDESTDNNFAIYGEDTIVVEENNTNNQFTSIDEEEMIYVVENADTTVTSLAVGDIFVYEAEDEIIIIKVAHVEVDGTTATIYGSESSMEEVFSYVKIDESAGTEEVDVDTSECGEGVEYQGVVETEDKYATESVIRTENGTRMKEEWETGGSASPKLKYEFGEESPLRGNVEFGVEFSVKLYITPSLQYAEMKMEYEAGFEVELTDDSELEIEIPIGEIGTDKIKFVKLSGKVNFVVALEAKISFSGKLTGQIGWRASSDDGIKDISKKPKFKTELKGEFKGFIGFEIEPKMMALSEDVLDAEMEARFGAEITGELMLHESDEDTKERHDCKVCVEGEIFVTMSVKAKVTLTSKWKKSMDKEYLKIKICDWFYSADLDKFGMGKTCPNRSYRVDITVLDLNGNVINNAQVDTGNNYCLSTVNGKTKDYLGKGTHTIKVEKEGYLPESKTVKIKDKPRSIVIYLSVAGSSGNGNAGGGGSSWGDDDTDNRLALGSNHSGYIAENGSLYMWGGNERYYDYCGQLGTGVEEGSLLPVKVLDYVKSVSVGEHHSGAITEDGSLYMWGNNYYGQLGTGTEESSLLPVKVLDNVKSVNLGDNSTGAITEDGSLYMWGGNIWGQLGTGVEEGCLLPVKVMDHVKSVSVGEHHSGAITEDGSLYMWGNNYYGQLGTGTEENSLLPVKVMDHVKSVSVGWQHSGAITEDGSLYMWGENMYGALGTGTDEDSLLPVKVMDNVKSVSLGHQLSGAITEDGSLYMWGDNFHGSLGSETSSDSWLPIKVLHHVKSVSLGDYYSGAITEDGSLYMWGWNECGQLGNGTTTDCLTPTKISIPVETEGSALSLEASQSGAISKTLDTQSGTVSFTGLQADTTYNLYSMKSQAAEDIWAGDNLLYVKQTTSDASGNVSVSYHLREDYENAEAFLVCAKQTDLSSATITVKNLIYNGKEQFVKPVVKLNGQILVEGRDYDLEGNYFAKDTGKYTVTIRGIGMYCGTKDITYSVVKNTSGNTGNTGGNTGGNGGSTSVPSQQSQIEAFVKRMYTVALNREAEAAGLKDWSSQLAEQKIDGAGIANGFINSAEFTNRNLGNREFLDTLYETFFNRAADAGGKAYWMQQLSNGMSRTEVLSGFVNSQEFSNLCDNYGIARGTMQPNGSSIYRPGVRNYVLRMYTKALNRAGETVGVEDWTNRINTGAMSAENVAKSFFSSQEFMNRNLSNSAYVETLYQTFMDRPSDAGGKQYWIDKLNSGMSREQVLEGFSRSAEFSEIMSRYGL